MADAYKGLTIEISGDTTKLSAAIKSAKSEALSAGRAIGEVNKAMKVNPSSVTLAAQKYQLCQQRVAATKQKLDSLNAAQEKYGSLASMSEQERAGYEKVQRQIALTEADLRKYNERLAEAKAQYEALQTPVGQLGARMQELGARWQGVGDSLYNGGKKITTVFAAAGGAALAAYSKVDAGEKDVIRTTGATGQAAEELRGIYKKVALEAPGDFETVGNAVGSVSQKFGVAGDDLESLSVQFLKFASNTGVDVSNAIQTCGNAMAGFGLDASHASGVLDMFQAISQQSGVSVDTLMSEVAQNGASFRAMGLDITQSTQLLAQFERAGVPASQALAGLKKAAALATKEGKPLGQMLTDLANKFKDPATRAEAAQEAIELFGSRSGMALVDAFEHGEISFDDLNGTLDDYSGAVNRTKDETTTGMDRIKGAFKAVTEAGAEIGELLAPGVEKVAGVIKGLADTFMALPDPVKQFVASAIVMGTTIGAVSMGIGGLIKALSPVGSAIVKVVTLFFRLGSAISGVVRTSSSISGVVQTIASGPVGIVIAAIAAIVAALIVLYNTNEDFRNFVNQLIPQILDKMKQLWTYLQPVFDAARDAIGKIIDVAKEVWGYIKPVLEQLWATVQKVRGDIKPKIDEFVQKYGPMIEQVLKVIIGIVGGALPGAFQAAASIIGGALTAIAGIFQQTFGAIELILGIFVGIFTGDWSMAAAGAQNIASGMNLTMTGIFGGMSGAIQGITSALGGALQGAWSAIGGGISSQAQTMFNNVTGFFRSMAENIRSVPGRIAGFFGGIGGRITSQFWGIQSGVAGVFSGVLDRIRSIPSQIVSFFRGLGSRITGAIGSIHFPRPHVTWGHLGIGNTSVPLPYVNWYANGGIFTRPALVAGLGDSRKPEVAEPVDKLASYLRAEGIATGRDSGPRQVVTVTVNVDAKVAQDIDVDDLGRRIGAGVANRLKMRGVQLDYV